jgi:hypothetical protein
MPLSFVLPIPLYHNLFDWDGIAAKSLELERVDGTVERQRAAGAVGSAELAVPARFASSIGAYLVMGDQ